MSKPNQEIVSLQRVVTSLEKQKDKLVGEGKALKDKYNATVQQVREMDRRISSVNRTIDTLTGRTGWDKFMDIHGEKKPEDL